MVVLDIADFSLALRDASLRSNISGDIIIKDSSETPIGQAVITPSPLGSTMTLVGTPLIFAPRRKAAGTGRNDPLRDSYWESLAIFSTPSMIWLSESEGGNSDLPGICRPGPVTSALHKQVFYLPSLCRLPANVTRFLQSYDNQLAT